MALVVCAFAGCTRQDSNNVKYLGGSNFSTIEDYVEEIEEVQSETDIVIVPCAVRHALEELSMKYVVVFPSLGSKQEYLKRYKDSETKEFMEEHWEDLICEMQIEDYSKRIILGKGEYIEDILEVIKRVGYDD